MKIKIILLIIFLLLIGLFYVIHRPQIIAIHKLKNILKEKEYKIKNAYNIDKENKNYTENEKTRIEKEIARLNKKIPPEQEEIALLKRLTGIARSSGINRVYFKKIEKKKVRGRRTRKGSQQGGGASNVEISPMEVEIQSDYRSLAQFLKKIKNISRLVTVENVLIEMDEIILPKLKITLTINSYYLPVPKVDEE